MLWCFYSTWHIHTWKTKMILLFYGGGDDDGGGSPGQYDKFKMLIFMKFQ